MSTNFWLRTPGRRRQTLLNAESSSSTSARAVALASPAGYRTARSARVPLDVHAAAGASSISDATAETADAHEPAAEGAGGGSAWLAILLLLVLLPLAVLVWRPRDADPSQSRPDVIRAESAAATFHASAGSQDEDPADALAAFIAAWLGCPPAAVIGPDLASRLVNAGVPAELASRSSTLLEDFMAARYGGSGPAGDAKATARALVDELDSAFRSV